MILITGGLGYIGSHIANLLGSKSLIIDNKCNSNLNYKKLLSNSIVYINDLNSKSLNKIFSRHSIEGVIHMAGLKSVNESTQTPLKYYAQNVISSLQLLECMEKFNIKKLIFSSSATVYGNNNKSPLQENMTLNSVNPYGSTKIIIEQMIDDYSKSKKDFKAVSLRYFNPIGADYKAGLSDRPLGNPQNLIPVLIKSIKTKKKFKIFGNDYDTKDGTCVRDYIHVKDLAYAHVLTFSKLNKFKGHTRINLGLGKGLSVLEIINLFEKTNNLKIDYLIGKRRKGDAAKSFSDNKLALKKLGWRPKFSYEDMLRDAWQASIK